MTLLTREWPTTSHAKVSKQRAGVRDADGLRVDTRILLITAN
jgi:hypothetical protein